MGVNGKDLKLEENKGKKICGPSRQRFLRYDIKDMVKREKSYAFKKIKNKNSLQKMKVIH